LQMAAQKRVIRELESLPNARKGIPTARFFTPDFKLHDPGAGVWMDGPSGAQDMIDTVLALGPKVTLEVLDRVE